MFVHAFFGICECNCGGAVSRLYYVVKREGDILYLYSSAMCLLAMLLLSNIPATAGQDHSSLPTLGH